MINLSRGETSTDDGIQLMMETGPHCQYPSRGTPTRVPDHLASRDLGRSQKGGFCVVTKTLWNKSPGGAIDKLGGFGWIAGITPVAHFSRPSINVESDIIFDLDSFSGKFESFVPPPAAPKGASWPAMVQHVYIWHHQQSKNRYPWFKDALQLEAAGDKDEALMVLFRRVDDLLLGGQFSYIDQWLGQLVAADLSIVMLAGILSITRAADDRIPHRQAFFQAAWGAIVDRGRDARKLIGALRGRRTPNGDRAPLRR